MSLSPRALALALAIGLLAIAGVWAGEPLQGVWRWLAALWLLLVAWERLRLAQDFTIRRRIGGALALGEPAHYEIRVSHRGTTARLLETQPEYPAALEADNPLQRWRLAPGDRALRQLAIMPIALGAVPLGPLHVRVLGGFGLCWWSQRHDDGLTLQVVPAALSHAAGPGNSRAGDRRNRLQAGSGVDLLEMRDYRPGDLPHAIDWKATARRGKPVVRRFQRDQRLQLAVLVDCGRASRVHAGNMQRLQHYVNVAARLAELAARHDDQVGCLAYAQILLDRAPLAGGTAAVQRARHLLGGLAATAEESNPLIAALEVRRLIPHRGLVVFLTDIEQPEAASQLFKAVQLLAARHQVLVASVQDPSIVAIGGQPAEGWLDPYRQFAAQDYLRSRELTRQKLQRGGVAVVTAPVEHLDGQVLDYYRRHRLRISA
ncbi:MAG TPA: DUF58 domain-containing protein [Methylococcaceae bacterium]|nr:DUF58 domain-containing protein [Methylococcaceae bacterium]